MKLKRLLRHPNAIIYSFVFLGLGLGLSLFVSSISLRYLGLGLAGFGLLMVIATTYETQTMFWRSQLEWWDADDSRFEAWQEGKQ